MHSQEFTIPVTNNKKISRLQRLKEVFLVEKYSNPWVMGVVSLICIAISLIIVKSGLIGGVLCIAALIALPALYTIMAYPRIGIFLYLIFGYFIMWLFKLGVNFPLGTLMDGMLVLFIIGVLFRQHKYKDWSMFKTPISIVISIWLVYNILEVFNPAAESKMAWVYTVRTVAFIMFAYFIFVYYIDTKLYIKQILKLWIALATFAALYALKQEFVGFFGFEETYLHSDPGIELLLFIGGVWRKFSIFSDPVAFSYNMITASLMTIGLLTSVKTRWKQIVLLLLVLIFIWAMLYSGTRGAYVLLPASLIMFVILKFNRTLMILSIVLGIALGAIVLMPTSNYTILRFQSAFKPSDDASFNLRKMNQKRIQPYIQSHPLGGGLGSTGEWGKKFAPNSYLAHFPPDSGYVRVAVEMGWLGLLLFCIFMFTALATGIISYYKIKDPELKSYCLGMILVVFALNFGNYPQEALVQYPSNVYFYLALAIITVSYRIDKHQNNAINAR